MSQAAVAEPDLGPLPEWDLTDLYSGPDSTEIAGEFDRLSDDIATFKKRFEGGVADLKPATFGSAIGDFEAIQERLWRIGSYAQLLYATDMTDTEVGQFSQNTREKLNDLSADLLFFTLELNRIKDADLTPMLEDASVLHYASWIRNTRLFRDYELSDELERLLHDKEVSGRGAWLRLFDETSAALRFDIGGKALTSQEALNLLSDKDEAIRRGAAEKIGRVFDKNVRVFALITNTLAKDKEIDDRWRGYPAPNAARHLSNQIEPEVIDALTEAVQAAYPQLSHRYYQLKAEWLGKKKLAHWDRNAPLPDDDDQAINWITARDTVLNAYRSFSGELADIGGRFFENAWIDAPVRPGKVSGAFAHSTVPSAHPYLLLNYQGKARDVMTLAHELGHGVHQVLAAPQGALLADTPLTLAETASVFGEQLTFRALLDAESDARLRRVMLAGKVEDMINTVVRQIAFYEFERRVHDERGSGELTAERIGEIWLQVQIDSLGPAFTFDDSYRHYWSYIPHFVHSPFYVYAYAFGDCLVNSLYAVYLDGTPDFEAKYLEMLRAGGTLGHRELLAPFGLDATAPDFWARGLDVISGFIDELETN